MFLTFDQNTEVVCVCVCIRIRIRIHRIILWIFKKETKNGEKCNACLAQYLQATFCDWWWFGRSPVNPHFVLSFFWHTAVLALNKRNVELERFASI